MSPPDEMTRNLRSPDELTSQAGGREDEQTLDAAPAVQSGELAPGTMIGEYQIEDRVGQGAMGVVYGAVHPVIGKRAAVKVMRSFLSHSPEAIERFVQEARAVGRIGHPNIVDAFAFGVLPDGRCYFIMEWLKGCPLSHLVKHGPMPLDAALDVLDQVCRALEAAHAQGIIHRDLKPDNVFLQEVPDSRPVVKLLDFSIAKLADDEGARRHLTRTGVMVGTPAYVSPEQVRGAKVDARTDVYALGIMTFEMVTGRLPFNPENRMALLFMHLNDPPPPASSLRHGVPPALDLLLSRMLAKQPEARPTPREIRQVVAELREQLAAPLMAPAPAPVPAPRLIAAPPVVMVQAAGPTPTPTPAPIPMPSHMPMPAPLVAVPTPVPFVPMPTPVPSYAPPPHQVTPIPTIPAALETHGARSADRRLLAAGAVAIAAVIAASLTVVFVSGSDGKPAAAAEPPAAAAPGPEIQQAVTEKLPVPPPPPPAPTGITLSIDADEAIVVLDGRIVGDSARRLNLVLDEPGRHELEITAPGRRPFRKTVQVDAGTTLAVRAELAPDGRGAGRAERPKSRPRRVERAEPPEGPGARIARDKPVRRAAPSDDDDGTINPYPRKR